MDDDPLDSLLDIEEDYYQEGYELGEADGAHAGYVEGKLFGIEKGYEKGLAMGKMFGKALVWKSRLRRETTLSADGAAAAAVESHFPELDLALAELARFSEAGRLGNNIDQVLATTDLDNISSGNEDDSVADFDDRLKKAAAKIKIISRVIGEHEKSSGAEAASGDGTGNIEDISSLSVRR